MVKYNRQKQRTGKADLCAMELQQSMATSCYGCRGMSQVNKLATDAKMWGPWWRT